MRAAKTGGAFYHYCVLRDGARGVFIGGGGFFQIGNIVKTARLLQFSEFF